MKLNLKFRATILILALPLLAAAPALAASAIPITIDGAVTHDVWGNGTPPNGVPLNMPNPRADDDGSVTINSGGTVGGDIYGSYISYIQNGYMGSEVHAKSNDAKVNNGGTVVGNVYGGYASANYENATASGNTVDITGGTVGGNIYGGYADGVGVSTATSNTVTISGSPVFTAGNIYGGFIGGNGTGTGDAFSGNTLNKNSGVSVNMVGNFENINFGYSGDANITTLDTTPTGSPASGVNIDTGSNNVNFNGAIKGDGDINKKGPGTLTLTDVSGLTGDIILTEGTIENQTGGDIYIIVNGVRQLLRDGESFPPNTTPNTAPNTTPPDGRRRGGCDAGVGFMGLAILALLAANRGGKGRQ